MRRLFGLSQDKPKPDLQQAISSTDERADATQVKISRLGAELARYRDQMKRMPNGPGKNAVQQRAMRVLQQRRLYESQLGQLTQQSFNMEQSLMTSENLKNSMATVDAMQLANKQLRRTYGNFDVDKIENIQDEMEDLMEQSNALQETMSRSYGVPDDIDEAELEAELEALEEPDEQTAEVPSYLQQAAGILPAQPEFIDELPEAKQAHTAAERELRAA
ncbi:Vacuolar protein-sorting-associated protein 60 [Malassezia sp. CBS 17886]|nr:Vacuolar protein-sorting-associated protein 60 [Malassezia sp. CBS 17886]